MQSEELGSAINDPTDGSGDSSWASPINGEVGDSLEREGLSPFEPTPNETTGISDSVLSSDPDLLAGQPIPPGVTINLEVSDGATNRTENLSSTVINESRSTGQITNSTYSSVNSPGPGLLYTSSSDREVNSIDRSSDREVSSITNTINDRKTEIDRGLERTEALLESVFEMNRSLLDRSSLEKSIKSESQINDRERVESSEGETSSFIEKLLGLERVEASSKMNDISRSESSESIDRSTSSSFRDRESSNLSVSRNEVTLPGPAVTSPQTNVIVSSKTETSQLATNQDPGRGERTEVIFKERESEVVQRTEERLPQREGQGAIQDNSEIAERLSRIEHLLMGRLNVKLVD